MGSSTGANCIDLWSEIIATEDNQPQQAEAVYRRRKPLKPTTDHNNKDVHLPSSSGSSRRQINRGSFVLVTKRVSWNRSLSTRGRTSVAVGFCVVHRPHERKKGKPPLPKGKFVPSPSFDKQKEYFEEVDAFQLIEESPSPKKPGTWVVPDKIDKKPISYMCSRLEKWLISKKLNRSCGPNSTLSKILDTPGMSMGSISVLDSYPSNLRTPSTSSAKGNARLDPIPSGCDWKLLEESLRERDLSKEMNDEECKGIGDAVKKLSLASSVTADSDHLDPFSALLAVCGQSGPLQLKDALSRYCEPETITKLGEGTYGEAFKIGNNVWKIVPVDGDFLVNGEIQKRSQELLEEVILSKTLNLLRGQGQDTHNSCNVFIETLHIAVCQGSYDSALIKAWEDWDEKNGSENDHPKDFPEKQRYVIFVLEHGGKDLENFVLSNFREARSFLVQVTAGLAVAESAFEFEHRDLHWGNVLLSRNDSMALHFTLEGKQMTVKTYGLSVSIIDFTLSRINTGDDILFLDLSSDPYLFKGPKGDKQAETYRKMKDVTGDYWEESFPRTNVLWLLYLVDILLQKKSFERTSKDEREMRSLKKRFDQYNSAKEAIFDPFFSDLFVDPELALQQSSIELLPPESSQLVKLLESDHLPRNLDGYLMADLPIGVVTTSMRKTTLIREVPLSHCLFLTLYFMSGLLTPNPPLPLSICVARLRACLPLKLHNFFMPSPFLHPLTLPLKMVSGVSLCVFLVLPLLVVYSCGMSWMEDLEELGREEQQGFPSSHSEMLGKVHLRRTLDDTSLPTPTPTVITVPGTFPVAGTPKDPTATPVPVSSTPPVTLPPSNPVSTPVPVTNPVTTPSNSVTSYPPPAPTVPVTNPVPNPTPPATTTAPATPGQSWCVAKTGASQASLQAALDYACGIGGADCSQIQQGASCYNPNTLQNHASNAFNSYYQKHPAPTSCDFGGLATVVNANPSSGSCNYPSSSTSTSSSTSPMTTTPTSTPTSPPFPSGIGSSSSGTPPADLNSSSTPAGMAPLFGGSDTPPTVNTTSPSTNLQPLVSRLILMTTFAIGKLSMFM